MKIDVKGLFFIIALLVTLFSVVFEVKAENWLLMIGIVIALFYSYGDLTKA